MFLTPSSTVPFVWTDNLLKTVFVYGQNMNFEELTLNMMIMTMIIIMKERVVSKNFFSLHLLHVSDLSRPIRLLTQKRYRTKRIAHLTSAQVELSSST